MGADFITQLLEKIRGVLATALCSDLAWFFLPQHSL